MTASYRDNIRARMTEQGFNMKQLSLKAGLGETGAREIILGIRRSPTVETLEKLARALGCTASDLIAEPHQDTRRIVTPLPIIGTVEGGVWQKTTTWPESEWFHEPIPSDPRFNAFNRFGLLVQGNSMDALYADGGFVVCILMSQLQEQPESGRRYIVHKLNKNGETEASIKEYFEDSEGNQWLMPKSSNPAHQLPIQLNGRSSGSIKLYARITGFWRKES